MRPFRIETTLTRTGIKLGTAGYMSPEQVRGEPLDARTDIFSFGLVLYEMATGQRAFSGETAVVVRDAILNNSPAPVRELNSTLPARLVATIDKCLEKERERAISIAPAEIRSDLTQVLLDSDPHRMSAPRAQKRGFETAFLAISGCGVSRHLAGGGRHFSGALSAPYEHTCSLFRSPEHENEPTDRQWEG